jgi:hypothetical protein
LIWAPGAEGSYSGIAAESEQPPGNDAQVIGTMWRGRALNCTSGLSSSIEALNPLPRRRARQFTDNPVLNFEFESATRLKWFIVKSRWR